MRVLRRKLWNSIFTQDLNLYNEYLWNRMEDFSILLLGETGSGKGTAATAIGRSGFIPFNEKKNSFEESFMRSFTAINLSQFPENLIESELFGHKKGAFTGATEDHQGVFDYGSPHGAIFLDEIGEVSIPIQIKLLNVLQDREFSPVGSHEKRVFKGRVIAATNIPLESLRARECLRDDFYYRLCSDVIVIPPLRQRIKEDSQAIDELISLIVSRIIGQPSKNICLMVKKVIDDHLGNNYLWPGNVRELGQCVRRVLINNEYAGDKRIIPKDQDEWFIENIRKGEIDAQSLLAGYCYMQYLRDGTYEAVANRTHLDRRTVKKYIDEWKKTKME
jgi:transcriptional regulator with PAS, ATPase and Fis domain